MDITAWNEIIMVIGPTASIAVLALWLNHQLMMKWTDRFDEIAKNNRSVAKALGEITEALRRLNGKE